MSAESATFPWTGKGFTMVGRLATLAGHFSGEKHRKMT